MVKILALLVVFTIIGGSICAQQIESRTQEDKLRALKQFLTKTHQNKKKLIEKFQIGNCRNIFIYLFKTKKEEN